jgi:hypothetical protein
MISSNVLSLVASYMNVMEESIWAFGSTFSTGMDLLKD